MVTTLIDIVDRAARLSPVTKKVYRYKIQLFLDFAPDPATWTPLLVEDWRQHLIARGLTSTTVNNYIYTLKFCSKRWYTYGLGPDFAASTEAIRIVEQQERDGLSSDEQQRLLRVVGGDSPPDLRDRAFIVVGIMAGGRRVSEMVNWDWDKVAIRRNATIATFRQKGGGLLRIPFDDQCLSALAPWHAFCGNPTRGPVFCALRQTVSDTYERGPRWSRQAAWQMIGRRGRQAGIRRHLHPHLLRYTFVNMCLENGVHPHEVMRLTGHKSLETMSSYVQRFKEIDDGDPARQSLFKLPGTDEEGGKDE